MSIYDNLDTWPIDLLIASDNRWAIKGNTVTSDASLSGLKRFTRTDGGGWWACEMSGVKLWSPEDIKLARALIARADGGAAMFDVPACECAFAPWPGGIVAALVPHTDGTTFDDGSEYLPSVIDIVLEDDAALRATTIKVRINAGADLLGGEAFSLVHPNMGKRIYQGCGVTPVTDGTDDLYWVDIRTPLREAATAGAALDFENPSCVMRLVNAEDAMEAISLNRFSGLSLQFQEAF